MDDGYTPLERASLEIENAQRSGAISPVITGRLTDPRWIPVSERPIPRGEYETFLVANATSGLVAPHIRGVIHNNVGTAWDWNYGEAITHWMPLPDAPPR